MGVDIRIRVRGGGKASQIYAIRQSIAKALVAFHHKYVDEQSKKEIKDILVRYDRTLLVADPRRCVVVGSNSVPPSFSETKDQNFCALPCLLDSEACLPILELHLRLCLIFWVHLARSLNTAL